LRDPDLAERVEVALKGTGISVQEVTRRIEIGAGNAALERQWLGQDLKAIAERGGFDLSRADELETAIDRLDQLHTDSHTTVTSYRQFDTNTVRPFDDWCRLAFWCGLTHTLIDLLRVFPRTCRLPGNALR
jgi:hypothetical protein